MAEDRITAALRPSKKEIDAQRIEIECVEPPGGEHTKGAGYVVCVFPKEGKPGEKEKGVGWTKPIKRVFRNEEETLAYLKKVL